MTSLLYNADTKRLIDAVSLTLPHALLLAGPVGVGLRTIALDIAWHDLAGIIESTAADGTIDISAKGIIRVSQIREVIELTKGRSTKRRVIIIDDAEKMNHQAQNAFLKLLEEPTEHTHFILTSHTPQRLLPTVLSRVQRINVGMIGDNESRSLLKKMSVTDPKKIEQLLFLGAGRPALMTRLAQDDTFFASQTKYATDAKQFIQGTPYQRVHIAYSYHNDRVGALAMLTCAQQFLTFSLKSQPSEQSIHALDLLADTYDRIAANGSIRLQLMRHVLQ